jgi:hypothetical protein
MLPSAGEISSTENIGKDWPPAITRAARALGKRVIIRVADVKTKRAQCEIQKPTCRGVRKVGHP